MQQTFVLYTQKSSIKSYLQEQQGAILTNNQTAAAAETPAKIELNPIGDLRKKKEEPDIEKQLSLFNQLKEETNKRIKAQNKTKKLKAVIGSSK